MKKYHPKGWPALALAIVIGCTSATQAIAGTAFVHLFEWKWTDIANECETFLGPKGFDAVQISPPYEHINLDTWWARYQPVSYQLISRSGNEAELQDMVNRCHAVGVKIYADLVINHTAAWNGGGTGTAGTNWSTENHPMYSSNDYHSPRYTINHYGDAGHVWNGRLSDLPDLNTSSNYVQDQLAGYINHLINIGVDGFRIDAAKHMDPNDISGILNKAGNPWNFLEVIGAGGEAAEIQPDRYTHLGQVTEFKYGTDVASNFNGQIKNLQTLGASWGLLQSSDALIFVDNHDRERGHGGGGTLSYKDGAKYNLANVYMLAFPYGYPKIMSGYEFTDTDAGPPGGSTNCDAAGWVCQHRWNNIANMVGFRNHTVGAWSVNNWWDNGNSQIAFSRGNKGFVVINNESGTLNRTFATGLPAGNYCNVLAGDDACSGEVIIVDASGNASINIGAMSAAAIHGGAMDDGSCIDCCTEDCGGFNKIFPSLTFRGTPNGWAATDMSLVANNTWQVTINFDGQSNQRFKFDVNGDWSENYGDNGNDGFLDLIGADISTGVVGEYIVEVNDSSKAWSLASVGNNIAPNAAITPQNSNINIGDSVVFDAGSSSDTDGSIVSYSWSDGNSGSSNTVTYNTAGNFDMTVTVTDDGGKTDSATASISVQSTNDNPPSADIDPSSSTITVGDIVNFNAAGSSDDGNIVSYSWSNGDSGSTTSITFNSVGTEQISVTVTDDSGQTDTATATITVQGDGNFQSNFSSLFFRGTPNGWGTTAMSLVADNTWELVVDFDGQNDQRYKFDVNGDWSQNYGDNSNDGTLDSSGGDISTDVNGQYKVIVNDATLAYSITKVGGTDFAQNFSTLFFRGTANGWGTTAMSLVADNIWEASINFDGQNDQRYKLDVNGDWSQNYGDDDNNGTLDSSGADITTNVVGQFSLRVNDQTLSYELISQ